MIWQPLIKMICFGPKLYFNHFSIPGIGKDMERIDCFDLLLLFFRYYFIKFHLVFNVGQQLFLFSKPIIINYFILLGYFLWSLFFYYIIK